MRKLGITRRAVLAGLLAALPFAGARRVRALPVPEEMVGGIDLHVIREGDTLPDIAVARRVGYIELVAANPGIDAWLPPVGTTIVIPDEHVLPDAPREGIVVNLAEFRLYYFRPEGGVLTMPIGIGTEATETPLGETTITLKRPNPTWWPPESIRARRPELPKAVPPGPNNPLGAYALNLGWPRYVIHGTNKSYGVGRRVSNGCVRMYPADIKTLFDAVEVGTPVRVVHQPVKVGWSDGGLYLEVHPLPAEANALEAGKPLTDPTSVDPTPQIVAAASRIGRPTMIDWPVVRRIVRERRGVPGRISARPAGLTTN